MAPLHLRISLQTSAPSLFELEQIRKKDVFKLFICFSNAVKVGDEGTSRQAGAEVQDDPHRTSCWDGVKVI